MAGDMKDYKQEFLKCINSIDYSKRKYDIFQDFLEISSICFENIFLTDNQLEKRYFELINQYKNPNLLSDLLAITSQALTENPRDFLGEIYMFENFRNKNAQQFFTPYHISEFMAEIALFDKNLKEIIEKTGYISISEPCCGSGCMIIAVSEVLKKHGYNPQQTMWFQGVDIDITCSRMAYIQTTLLGLSGEIIHGDTLKLETWHKYSTPMLILNVNKFENSYKNSMKKDEIERSNNYGKKLTIEQLSLFAK